MLSGPRRRVSGAAQAAIKRTSPGLGTGRIKPSRRSLRTRSTRSTAGTARSITDSNDTDTIIVITTRPATDSRAPRRIVHFRSFSTQSATRLFPSFRQHHSFLPSFGGLGPFERVAGALSCHASNAITSRSFSNVLASASDGRCKTKALRGTARRYRTDKV